MKNLWRSISPLLPDVSGAMTAFIASPSLIVGMDSRMGLARSRGGANEPGAQASVTIVNLPETDYIAGDEDAFIRRIEELYEQERAWREPELVVVLNAPVSALTGVDVKGIARRLQERFGVPVLGIETTGNRAYDKGIAQAYEGMLSLADEGVETCPGMVNVLGCTLLDLPGGAVYEQLLAGLQAEGTGVVSNAGYTDSLAWWKWLRAAERNIVVTGAALPLARKLQAECGMAFTRIDELAYFDEWAAGLSVGACGKVLVFGEQVQSMLLRRLLRRMGADEVDIATFATCDRELRAPGDCKLSSDTELAALVRDGGYAHVIGDATIAPLVPAPAQLLPLAWPAVQLEHAYDVTELTPAWLAWAAGQLADGGKAGKR